ICCLSSSLPHHTLSLPSCSFFFTSSPPHRALHSFPTRRSSDLHLPMCAGIVAISAWADLTCSGESMTSRAAADIECTRAGLLEMVGCYMNGADPSQPLASPVFADLAGVPPLLCVVGEDEILLDDSIRLVRNAGT